MAISLGKSLALTAALGSLLASPGNTFSRELFSLEPRAIPAILPVAPDVATRSSRKKKRRPAPKLTPVVWRGGRSSAKQYGSRRSLPAGRTSTLRKTAKLLRLQAGGY